MPTEAQKERIRTEVARQIGMETSEAFAARAGRRPVTVETILTLALDGTDEECLEATGLTRARVIQEALQLADDPTVALEHPALVQRIWDRVEAGRAARSAARLK